MNKENCPKLNAKIQLRSGFLVDIDIKRAMENQQLIVNGNPEGAKYATYELTIGSHVEQLVMDDGGNPNPDLYRGKAVPEDGVFAIHPGETFKIYAHENIHMPADVVALAVPVGIMYKLGLNPETTFADPGFSGEFFVTVCNYSPRIVKLTVGNPLARMFFFKLEERPDKIHEGSPREFPPAVERVPKPSDDELARSTEAVILSTVLKSVDPPHYEHAFVTNRIVSIHRTQIDDAINSIRQQLRTMRRIVVGLGAVIAGGLVVLGIRAVAGQWPNLTVSTWGSLLGAGIWVILVWLIAALRKWV